MEYQSLLHKKLLDGNFVYTAETTPPDSSDQEVLLKKTKPLKNVADAVNLTDSPGAKVHMSALTAAIILVQNGIEPILQLTVRDRNRLALQGDLIGASALGVHNILCLSGDDPKIGDQPDTVAVNDIDSLTLIATANMMRNERKFPSGRIIEPPPKLCIGSAEVPTTGKPNPEKILNKISNSKNSGYSDLSALQITHLKNKGKANIDIKNISINKNPFLKDYFVLQKFNQNLTTNVVIEENKVSKLFKDFKLEKK